MKQENPQSLSFGSLKNSGKAVRALTTACQQLKEEVEGLLRNNARLLIELYVGDTKTCDDPTVVAVPCLATEGPNAWPALLSRTKIPDSEEFPVNPLTIGDETYEFVSRFRKTLVLVHVKGTPDDLTWMAMAKIQPIFTSESDVEVRFVPIERSDAYLRERRQADIRASCRLFKGIKRGKMRLASRNPDIPADVFNEAVIKQNDFAWDLPFLLYHGVRTTLKLVDVLKPFQWKERIRECFRQDFNVSRDRGDRSMFHKVWKELEEYHREAEDHRMLHRHVGHAPPARCTIPARMK